MKILKRIWWIPVLLLLAVGGLLAYRSYQLNQFRTALANVQTVKLANGAITTTVSATGSVRSNQSATLTWTLSGQVGKLLVQAGDTVKAGQTLASLGTSNLDSSVSDAQASLVTDQQALEDLKASQVDLTTAQDAVATAKTALDDAKRKRSYLNTTHGSADTIAVAQASYDVALQDVKQIQGYIGNMRPDNSGYLGAEISLSNAEKTLQQAYFTLNYAKSMPSAEEIATADAAVALAQAQYDDAVRNYNRLQSGPTAAEITAAQAKITADQQIIDSVNLKAPFSGVITEVQAYPGEAVAQGDTALRIDDLSAIYVDLSVSEVDINKVQVGQSAEITFDAIPEQTYQGTVTEVGQVGVTSSGVVNYPVTVQIANADEQVKTGMTAAANITTSSLTDILLVPTKSIKTVNSQKIVYLYRGGPSQPVTIQTGATSDSMTQIVSGNVKAGDVVLANPSTAMQAANAPGGFFLFGLLGGGPAGGPPPGGAGGPPPGGAGGPPGG